MYLVVVVILLLVFMILRNERAWSYETYLLTLPEARDRREVFFEHNTHGPKVHMVYGQDTRVVETARKFEEHVQSEFMEKAVEMHYDPSVVRPNITYFNLGAIGCHMGHADIWNRASKMGHKYALVFEDNVKVRSSKKLHDYVESFIAEKGDDFEACFFHCLHYLPHEIQKDRVRWISSTKCYLMHVPNMKRYFPLFFPMNNHIDLKFEDIIAEGARVYYRDLRKYLDIDRSEPSTIGHSPHEDEAMFSRRFPKATTKDLIKGW
jgi:GR25 family glycosyltransferase involved in LPS biosynthesis